MRLSLGNIIVSIMWRMKVIIKTESCEDAAIASVRDFWDPPTWMVAFQWREVDGYF